MNIVKLSAVILGIAVLLFAVAAFAEDSAITLAGLEGKVLVKIAPSTEWADAAIEQKLKTNDAIKTGDDGKAVLEFSDKSTVALKKNTELKIKDLVWNDVTRKADLDMPSGELRAMISKVKGPSQFKVRTPTAICGARGTVFYIMIVGGETKVFVTEGSVDFSNANGENSYVVVQNMAAISDISGNVSEPRELTGDEKTQALAGWNGVVTEPYNAPGNNGGNDDSGNDQGTPENPNEKPASQV